MYFKVLGKHYVVLNTLETAEDLLEKKGAVASNRPHFTMGMDLIGWGDAAALQQYGDKCRKYRSLFHRQIGTKSSLEAFHHAGEAESKRFVRNMLKSPEDLEAHTHRYVADRCDVILLISFGGSRTGTGLILQICYGYSVEKDDDPIMEMANKAIRNFSVMVTPGSFLVDELPICTSLCVSYVKCLKGCDSTIPSRVVSRRRVPHTCQTVAENAHRGSGGAPCVCVGTCGNVAF